jgi:hypothetical protein
VPEGLKVFFRSDDPENERADFGRKLVSILADIKAKTEQ